MALGAALRSAFARSGREERGHTFGDGGDYYIAAGRSGGAGFSADRALSIPAFYGGVAGISEATRAMPMQLRLWDPTIRGYLPTPPRLRLEEIVSWQPNEEQSAADFYELVTAWMLLRGDGFAWKEYERYDRNGIGRGVVKALWPVAPTRVQVLRDPSTRRKVYTVSASSEDPSPIWSGTRDDLIHFRAWGTDSLRGLGLVDVMRGLIGRARTEEERSDESLENMQKPSGVLEMPAGLGPKAMARLRKGWDARARGGTPILPDGVKYQRVSLSAADTQLIEQRLFTRGDFAIAMRLPASRTLAEAGGNLHYDSAEMDGQDFLTRTMLAWKSRLEDPLLIDPSLPWGWTGSRADQAAGRRLVPVMDTSNLTRADDLKTAQANAIYVKQGIKDANEVRSEIGLPARDDLPKPATPAGPSTTTTGGDHAADAAAA